MRWIRFAVLLVVVTLLQAAFVESVSIGGASPDLLLILLVFFVAYSNITDAIITSFIIGFTWDLIGTASMGPGMISFGLLGTLLGYLNSIFAVRTKHRQAVVILVMGILSGILIYLLNFFKEHQAIINPGIFIWGRSIYSAIAGPFLFIPFSWVIRLKPYYFGHR